MKISVLVAFVACTVSNRSRCDAFYGSVQVIPRTRHHCLCSGSSRSIIDSRCSSHTSYNHRRSHRRSSLKAAKGGGEEGKKCSSSPSSSDRRDFVRGAAVALGGCSATIFGGGRKAWGVGTQPGERTTAPPNPLLLVPALRAKLAVEGVLKLLKDPSKWDEAREALKSPPLAPADFKTCFRTYSDADPEQHLAFDLYRIQAQEALKAVSELLAYLASEKAKGAEIVGEDVEDLEDAGRSVLQGIDDFLKLAPREDVLMVERNTKDQAARTAAAKSAVPVGRELEGAVVGEGAFVAGARI